MSVHVNAQVVKELRSKTGAGMMDCKKALQASNGNMDIAIENLKKKGLIFANKKSSRITTEGVIESYIHIGSKIGVLVELNCETDFVARRPEFQQLAKDIAMQIAACSDVMYVSSKDVPKVVIDQITNIEVNKEDLVNKPKEIKEKVISGRVEKRLIEMSLIEQPFIKNQDISIENLLQQHISLLGENIKIRRFQRFLLGEGLEKNSGNLNK